jgi:hypothetical protein
MARRTLFVSDLSGEEIRDGEAAHVQIILDSKPASRFHLEVLESEIEPLLVAAREQKKRGRKPKSS